MTEHRDSPGIESEEVGQGRSWTTRRFAQLVESPAVRRIALPRILGAIGILLSLVILIGLGGSKMIGHYVSARPEYQLPFSEIELIPMPEPWLLGGKSRILEQIREEAKHGETLSLLDLDLKEFEKDFRRCAWVKDVIWIERSFQHLAVHLTYRKPVAVVVPGKTNSIAYPIDEEAVYLPVPDIDWISKESPIQFRGLSQPLIEIRDVESSKPPRIGMRWKRSAADDAPDDPIVLRAARLAKFLQTQEYSTPSGKLVPSFEAVFIPAEPHHPFYLQDATQNRVKWGDAPGDEKPGEISSDDRWKLLLDWIDRNGPLVAKFPSYLYFTRTKATIFDPKPKR